MTSPAWGTQAPHCCESLGHLPALLASGPITFLSVTVTQPLGSVGSKPGGVARVGLVLMGGLGVIYPLCRSLAPPRSRWAGGDTFCSHVGCMRVSRFRGATQIPIPTLQCLTSVPTMQSFYSFLKCQTWRAIVKDLVDMSETLKSCLFLIPLFLPFNVCFFLFCFVFM